MYWRYTRVYAVKEMFLEYLASRPILHTRHSLLGISTQLQMLSEAADNRGICDILHTYIHLFVHRQFIE